MKHLLGLFFFVISLLVNVQLFAQNSIQFDTISTYDVNLSDYMTTNGRVYMANGKVISKEKHEFYKKNWESVQNCQPCEVYTYNEHNQLRHIAIQYGECLVGPFKEYYLDGKLKIEGNFKSNTSNDWSSLRLRGLCSVREGTWNHYSSAGKLETIETYQNGKVVNVEYVKDSSAKDENSAINKVKGFFRKSSEE